MNPFEQLLTAPSSHGVSPELLEMLGQKASRDFLEKKASLNEAVVRAVKDHPELGNEHIRRVVEFANNATFQEMFQKSANKNVHFPLADPGVILRDLKDGGSPGHEAPLGGSNKDYHTAPPTMQKKDELQDGFNDLSNRSQSSGMFGQGEPIEKNAYAAGIHPESHANPYENVYDLHLKLRAAETELKTAFSHFSGIQKEAEEDLYSAVKYEVLSDEGVGLGGVVGALEQLGGKEKAAAILSPIVERLVEEGVRVDVLQAGLEKKAGVMINPKHPIALAFSGILKAAEEQLRTGHALIETQEGLAKTAGFLSRGA